MTDPKREDPPKPDERKEDEPPPVTHPDPLRRPATPIRQNPDLGLGTGNYV